ncbi:MAG: hypothetical protein ACNA70_00360, partial [Brevefilum sp.]
LVVEEQYERAIGVALGELTDLLVLPSDSKRILIEYLESNENERVALVPIDQTHTNAQNRGVAGQDGVVGFAHELISVDPAYRDLVDALFSDILIVRDARAAEAIQIEISTPIKIVTLSGLVFQANGVIISGQSPTGKRIGRTRQQSELQNELDKIEQTMEALSAEWDRALQAIKNLQVEANQLKEQVGLIEQEKTAASRNLFDTKDTQVRLKEQMSWHKERLSTLDENMASVQTQIGAGQAELAELKRQIAVAEKNELAVGRTLNELPLFELEQSLNHWQTHQLVAKNALEAARQRYQDNHNLIDTGQQRLQVYQTRRDGFEANLSEIEHKNHELKQIIEALQLKITSLEKDQVEPLAAISAETEKSVAALQKLEAHSHQQVIIAERQHTQLQLELGRRQDQVNHLRERIEDDFGLVSFDGEQKYHGPAPLPFNDSLVEDLPQVQEIPETLEDDIKRLKNQLRRMGAINPEAQEEYLEVKERFEFLTTQVADLEKASKDLHEVIETLDEMMETEFLKTFKLVNQEFSTYFSRLFNGGEAKLVFIDEDSPVEAGVEIEARLPGRRQQGLALLSGGERSLTAVALIFALLKVAPPPFCILDEVDAMLDESNVGRFVEELRELAKTIQVVIITHNRNTVQAADVIYGVTMGRDSTSQMISLKLEEVGDSYFA